MNDSMMFLDELAKMKQAWALIFTITPPADSVLYRWLCLFPMRDLEVAFQKAASGQRACGQSLTMSQIQNRIQSTLYVLKQQREKSGRAKQC
jgi:hypothetical protein